MAGRIDAHQHFWRIARADYGWLTPELRPLYRDFGPADLAPLLDRHGISRTVLVQAAPTVAETRYLLEIAHATPFVAGVVGWVDLAADDAPTTIAELARDPLLAGLRPMVQDIADDEWLLQRRLQPSLRAMALRGLVFDALVLPRHLSRLLVVIDRHPDLFFVIDHGAKPRIRDGQLDPWRADMAAVAARHNTACKFSGLVTEAPPDWKLDRLRPWVDHLLAVFGTRRLLWGSDWPVVNLAGGYDRWFEATQTLLAPLSDDERSHVLGGNAARVYASRRRKPVIGPAEPS